MRSPSNAKRLSPIVMIITAGVLASCARSAPDAGSESAEDSEIGEAQSDVKSQPPDCLYVGDTFLGINETLGLIKRFDATTGVFWGAFNDLGVSDSPRGMVFDRRLGPNANLIAVDQNANQPINGEVLRFRKSDGDLRDLLVTPESPGATWQPRGIVLKDDIAYVADLGDGNAIHPGRIARFDTRTKAFLGDLDSTPFPVPKGARGVVFGPDGYLYASVANLADPQEGQIVRFDPVTGALFDVFADSGTCAGCELRRPEGLVFGPDGKLYVAAFRDTGNPSTTVDQILVFDRESKAVVDRIPLYAVGGPRAFAQALLFGPGGELYVPISGGDFTKQGELRAYDVATHDYHLVTPSFITGGALFIPWYLTFCGTNPATLAYESPGNHCGCGL